MAWDGTSNAFICLKFTLDTYIAIIYTQSVMSQIFKKFKKKLYVCLNMYNNILIYFIDMSLLSFYWIWK